MQNLELRQYSRAELEQTFRTTRTDSIRRSLERAGYAFTTAGRGKTYTITITAFPGPPTPFETFAQREFACGPQTNFHAMQTHFFLLFYHPDYQFFPATYQAQFLMENYQIEISAQSLRNWKKQMMDRNWIAEEREKVRYYLCRKGEAPREITEKVYKEIWQEFFARKENGEDADALRIEICKKQGGMPRKQCGFTENAIESEKLQELRRILEGYT